MADEVSPMHANSASPSPSSSISERTVYVGLLEEGLLSLGFVLLVAALLSGLMLVERRTFARTFALDDRRREQDKMMWEDVEADEEDEDSSSVDDYTEDESERDAVDASDERRRRAQDHITRQPRVVGINDGDYGDAGGGLTPHHSRADSIGSVTSDDGDADGDDESFVMHRLANRISAATRSRLSSPPTTRRAQQ